MTDNTLEKAVESALTEMVKARRGLCLKWVCPGWAGVPDRIILLPGGRIIFAETKRPKGGRFSPLQRWWAKKLTGLGFYYVAPHNRDDVEKLAEYIDGTQGGKHDTD